MRTGKVEMPTLIVDSHVHVWADGHVAVRPELVPNSPPRGDASVQALQAAMQVESVSSAVLVQYIGYLWDNNYVAQAIKERPDIFVGVCRVDPDDPNAPDHLSHWTETCGFQGVRLGPVANSEINWLVSDLVDPLFDRAAALRVPVVVLTTPARLGDLLAVAERHTDLDIIIDHLADCDAGNPEHRRLLQRLANQPRVHLKTGHIWAGSRQAYPWHDKNADIKLAYDLFGPLRVIWGSDWSFNLRHGTYRQSITYLSEIAGFLTATELDAVMGGNAQRIWHFKKPANPSANSDTTIKIAKKGK